MMNHLVDPLMLGRPLALDQLEGERHEPEPREGASRKRRASRIPALLVMLVAALILVPAAFADDDDDDGGGAPMAFGDFVFPKFCADEHLVFTATDNGLPVNDTGQATFESIQCATASYTAQIVCVNVTLNTARFGYVIPPSSPLAGINVIWQVTDNNGAGQDTADYIFAFDLTGTFAQTCDTAAGFANTPTTAGNITVTQGGGGDDDDDDDDDGNDDDGDDDD
jgi:hypothetical protein